MSEDRGARWFLANPDDPSAPLEATRAFLRTYAADADGLAEIHAQIARTVAVNPRSIVRALRSIEALLAHPPADGAIARLVAWDGNRVLDDPSDAGAIAWLYAIAASMRGILGEQQPPPPTDESPEPDDDRR